MLVSRSVVLTIVAANGIRGSSLSDQPQNAGACRRLCARVGSNAGMLQHRRQLIAATDLSSYNTRREICLCLNSGGTSVGA